MNGVIVQISPSYFDEESIMGGGERYVHELCRELVHQGQRVRMLSFGSVRKRIEMEGYFLEVFPACYKGGFTVQNPWSVAFLSLLRDVEICHVHQISTMVSDLACLYCSLLGIPVCVTDHGGGGGRILHARLPWLQRLYSVAICQSTYAVMRLSNRPLKRITIAGGVDIKRFQPPEERRVTREFLFVGRLIRNKGILDLIHAFALVFKKEPDYRLRIVGRKYDSAYWEQIEEASTGLPITFVTEATDADVLSFYQHSLALILPSITPQAGGVSELMGFTMLEALACGTPVIVSSSGAMGEFVVDSEAGWVFKEGDIEGLANCMLKVIESGSDLSDHARTHALQYDWANVVDQHLAVYDAC